MLQRLPAQDAIILFLDFDTLRRGGVLKLLSPSKSSEEPEYQAFVRDTGFRLPPRLDLAAVSFGRDGEFLVIKGRFRLDQARALRYSARGNVFQGPMPHARQHA